MVAGYDGDSDADNSGMLVESAADDGSQIRPGLLEPAQLWTQNQGFVPAVLGQSAPWPEADHLLQQVLSSFCHKPQSTAATALRRQRQKQQQNRQRRRRQGGSFAGHNVAASSRDSHSAGHSAGHSSAGHSREGATAVAGTLELSPLKPHERAKYVST